MEVPSYVRAVSLKADGRGGEITIPSFSIRHMHPLASLAWNAVSLMEGGRGRGGEAIPSSSQSLTSRGSLGFVRVSPEAVQWLQDRIHKIGICFFSGYHLVSEVPRMDCVCLLWLLHKFHFLTAPLTACREGWGAACTQTHHRIHSSSTY